MKPARWPRDVPLDDRMLVVDPHAGRWHDARVRELPLWLRSGDLLVVNDAATLPASLFATGPGGAKVEVRLASLLDDGRWRAVLFGEGDWRTRTEDRPPPPPLDVGVELRVGPDLSAVIRAIDGSSARLVVLEFSRSGSALWEALYRHGRPIQYAYVAGPLELWHAQTPFAARPWSVEMPSAGRALQWAVLAEARRRGVGIAAITHAAGLSSTGDAAIDAALPFPERFDIPQRTIDAVARARAAGGRVIAVGTTVVRALEGCAALHEGVLAPGQGTTDLRIDGRFRPRVVDGILTGMHEAGSSHRDLEHAFVSETLLARAMSHALEVGYLGHEFGDVCLVLPPADAASRAAPAAA
jgi:S-adenosylmethionine:tRNA ribosyltransferase-isomerase